MKSRGFSNSFCLLSRRVFSSIPLEVMLLVVSLVFVAMFMGASSNYTVSVAAQYWRREDFPGVFACVNPVANVFNAVAPTIIAALIASALGVAGVFMFLLVAGIVALILMFVKPLLP